MHIKLSLVFSFIIITIFSACSFTKKTHVSKPVSKAKSASDANTPVNLTFIDDISIEPDGNSSSHKLDAYRSPDLKDLSVVSTIQSKYASLLEVSPNKVIRNKNLLFFIDDWWGTPYRYGGDSRSGIDCSAFVQLLYGTVFGIGSLPRTAQEQYDDSKKIKRINKLRTGDLVFFRIHSRHISHVGVYLQNNKFVSASLSAGVVISDLTDHYWSRYFVCGGEPEEASLSASFASEQ